MCLALRYTVQAYTEDVDLPAPQHEWMLTDTCGNASQGTVNGPQMNLYSVTYLSSMSVTVGNAANFAGVSSSYALSGISGASSA